MKLSLLENIIQNRHHKRYNQKNELNNLNKSLKEFWLIQLKVRACISVPSTRLTQEELIFSQFLSQSWKSNKMLMGQRTLTTLPHTLEYHNLNDGTIPDEKIGYKMWKWEKGTKTKLDFKQVQKKRETEPYLMETAEWLQSDPSPPDGK